MAHWRLLIIYSNKLPATVERALDVIKKQPTVVRAFHAVSDENSAAAVMWTRDPQGLVIGGRIAFDFKDRPAPGLVETLVAKLGGLAYVCETRMPLNPELSTGQQYYGTVQLCGFRRKTGLTDEQLRDLWFTQHTDVAIETQSTTGYVQNLVIKGTTPHFDGIVEEYFPPEARQSPAHFFGAPNDPEKMKANIERMMTSSNRFLDLETTEVIHLTDTRIY